uniref:Methyltransferase type 11 domain-containing protein n=3 Tax=Aegilops tauschii subsp. strangulata TaxID=200361 RepID=A0A453T4A9_AEGTS
IGSCFPSSHLWTCKKYQDPTAKGASGRGWRHARARHHHTLPPLPELAKERFQAPVPAYYCNLQLGASMEPAVRAAAASCSSYPSLHPPRALVARRLGRSSGLSLPARRVAVAAAAIALDPETKTEQNDTSETEVFACPVCYEPLIRKGPPGMNLPAIYRSGFKCSKCNKSFTSKDVFLDLTVTSGMKEYSELKPARTELFRSPLVSYLYERGWRQNFNRSGFPGRDEEFQMAQDYFQSVAGGILVDVSCGSGLFSRKFASSGAYSSVIALDFSENMLRQCYDYIKQEETPMNTNLALVRADISRLPFASCSIDAIHAGAAIHCWPSPSNAIAEISRVLKPGGVFVATTFLSTPTNSGLFSIDALKPLRQIVGPVNSSYNFFTEGELEDLCRSCGLVNYSSKVQRSFIMFSGQKP